jgi:SOS-response transcriptional repressor LexA
MAKSEEVLNFIKDWTATHQYPPRLEDIQIAFGFNTRGGAKWHVDQLVKAGLLDRQGKIARGITIKKNDNSSVQTLDTLSNK